MKEKLIDLPKDYQEMIFKKDHPFDKDYKDLKQFSKKELIDLIKILKDERDIYFKKYASYNRFIFETSLIIDKFYDEVQNICKK